MKTFLFSYAYKGSQWGFEIPAKDADDARARLDAIKARGKYDGELVFQVPAPGFVERLVRWWKS
jgi:hypothetical protein